jgi:hypothetical protein
MVHGQRKRQHSGCMRILGSQRSLTCSTLRGDRYVDECQSCAQVEVRQDASIDIKNFDLFGIAGGIPILVGCHDGREFQRC